MQLNLFDADKKKKYIEYIAIDRLSISEINYRVTRKKDDIRKLSERIARNGFEITRALWAHIDGDGYAVFAGGNRLEAAKLAGVETIPVVIHEGFTRAELIKLAIEDNENDEYHIDVPMVETWAAYALAVKENGSQQAAADALGCGQAIVSYRQNLHALPDWLKSIITKQKWNEGNCREFLRLSQSDNLSAWLTLDACYRHIANKMTAKKEPTAKHFAAEVDALNDAIKRAEQALSGFGTVTFYHYESDPPKPYELDARKHFVGGLKNSEARTVDEVVNCEYATNKRIAEEAKKYAEYSDAKENESKPVEVLPGQWWALGSHLLYCGDTSKPEFHSKIENAAFAFADPPYNAGADEWDSNFDWCHDWLIEKSKIVAVTPGISAIFDFAAKTKMPYVWSMSCYINNGMTRGAIGFGNWIYISLFSRGSIHKDAQDYFSVSVDTSKNNNVKHKGKKPLEAIKHLVKMFSDSGDYIIDPFLGSGTTLFACDQTGRSCIGGEISPEFCKAIIEEWQNSTGKKGVLIENGI